MSFDAAFTRTVGLEGGYSNNPSDPGGETNWGVTAAVARRHGYQGAMKDMPELMARDIYRADYWLLIHLDQIDAVSALIAAELFDIGVNCGPGVPVPMFQRALNAFNRQGRDYPDILTDGLAGSGTIAAFKAYMVSRRADGEKVLLAALRSQLGVRYLNVVEARPASEDFVFGWYKRLVAPA